jgi:hypothetical protein
MRSILWLFVGVMLMAQQPSGDKLERFKNKIGYKKRPVALMAAVGSTASEAKMVGSWPDMMKIPGIGPGWKIWEQSVDVLGDEALLYEWTLNDSNNGQIDVHCYHLKNAQSAEETFFGLASNSSMNDIPYGATVSTVGSLSAGGSRYYCFFRNHNVCVSVGCKNYAGTAEDIAHWLNGYIESQIKSEASIDHAMPKSVTINPPIPRVGQDFEIRFQMNNENVGGRYLLKESLGSDMGKFMNQFTAIGKTKVKSENLAEVFRAKKPGRGVYKYVLIDKKTSLFYKGDVSIDVSP